MWRAQIFVGYSNCCPGASMDIGRSIKSFLAAVQRDHDTGLENSVGTGNAEKVRGWENIWR